MIWNTSLQSLLYVLIRKQHCAPSAIHRKYATPRCKATSSTKIRGHPSGLLPCIAITFFWSRVWSEDFDFNNTTSSGGNRNFTNWLLKNITSIIITIIIFRHHFLFPEVKKFKTVTFTITKPHHQRVSRSPQNEAARQCWATRDWRGRYALNPLTMAGLASSHQTHSWLASKAASGNYMHRPLYPTLLFICPALPFFRVLPSTFCFSDDSRPAPPFPASLSLYPTHNLLSKSTSLLFRSGCSLTPALYYRPKTLQTTSKFILPLSDHISFPLVSYFHHPSIFPIPHKKRR